MQFLRMFKNWHKVLIIAIGFSIPIILTLNKVVQDQGASIAYSYDELKATEYYSQVYRLLQQVQNYRVLSSLSRKNPNAIARLNKTDSEIDTTFFKLEEVDKKYGEQLKTTELLKNLRRNWKELKEISLKQSPVEMAQIYNKFINESIIPLIYVISNNSAISLDPLTDGYSMFDTLTRVILGLIESLSNMQDYGINLIAKGKIDDADKILMSVLLSQAQSNLNYLKSNFEWTSNVSPQSGAALQKSFDTTLEDIYNFFDFFENSLIKGNIENLKASVFSDTATKALNSIFLFVKDEINALDSIFLERIRITQKQRTTVLIESGIMIAIAILFCFSVIREIKYVMSAIRNSSTHLVTTIDEIANTAKGMTKDIIKTSQSITDVSITGKQLVDTAQQSIDKASSVLDTAEKVENIALIGRKSTDDTIVGINNIQTQVNSIAENMIRLNKQSGVIGSIITSIEELARQTSLLAINVSLESAKSGKESKSFGVIAQEVNRLALLSKESIERMRAVLDDIINDIRSAVFTTDRGKESVAEGVKQSLLAGESFTKLSKSIVDARDAGSQIVKVSQQQFLGIEQLMAAVQNIKQASDKNSEEVKALEKVIQTLNNVSLVLKDMTELHGV